VNSTKKDVNAFKAMWDDIPRATKEVSAPDVDETIDISVDTRQYEIRISDEIAKSIKWQTVPPLQSQSYQKVQNQQIAHVIGSIIPEAAPETNGTTQSSSTALVKPMPTLSVLSNTSGSIPPARPLHVGEVRLIELKQRLQASGYNVVLGEGVLVCNGVVRVLKDDGGRGVRIEGILGEEGALNAYWEVRRAVYEGLAVV
jgi:Cleavage and polyadenylation factor 2 C-terminal